MEVDNSFFYIPSLNKALDTCSLSTVRGEPLRKEITMKKSKSKHLADVHLFYL